MVTPWSYTQNAGYRKTKYRLRALASASQSRRRISTEPTIRSSSWQSVWEISPFSHAKVSPNQVSQMDDSNGSHRTDRPRIPLAEPQIRFSPTEKELGSSPREGSSSMTVILLFVFVILVAVAYARSQLAHSSHSHQTRRRGEKIWWLAMTVISLAMSSCSLKSSQSYCSGWTRDAWTDTVQELPMPPNCVVRSVALEIRIKGYNATSKRTTQCFMLVHRLLWYASCDTGHQSIASSK